MGTRGLIKIIYKGKLKVANYGQWDHYLSGVGKEIQTFLKDVLQDKEQLTQFLNNVVQCKFADDAMLDAVNEDIQEVLKDVKNYHEQSDLIYLIYPEFSRDTGAKILDVILSRPVFTINYADFEKDYTFCEYCYTLNFDTMKIKVNNKTWDFKKYCELDLNDDKE